MRDRSLLLSAIVLLGSTQCGVADVLPAYVRGLWAYTSVGPQSCKIASHHISSVSTDGDGVVAVTAKRILYLNWFCDVVSVKRGSIKSEGAREIDPLTLSLLCSAEGQDFKVKEIWSLQRVFGKPVLVVYESDRPIVTALSKCE